MWWLTLLICHTLMALSVWLSMTRHTYCETWGNQNLLICMAVLNPKAKPTGYQHIKYGSLPNMDWKELLTKGFAECFRVLRPGGFLIFKWNATDIKVSEILKLTDQKPIFGHISGKRANTHWICFMKKKVNNE